MNKEAYKGIEKNQAMIDIAYNILKLFGKLFMLLLSLDVSAQNKDDP